MKALLHHWNLDWGTLFLFGLFAVLYIKLSNGKWARGSRFYFFGLFLMLLIESSPLHFLGMHYLLSAHMIIHVLLLLICGPLIVSGIPPAAADHRLVIKVSEFFNTYPWMGWIAGIGIMWFWHIPSVFNSVLPEGHVNSSFHPITMLHTASLLFSGICFSWPVISPVKSLRINPLLAVIYLFTACIGCSLLGLLLTFAPPVLYRHYFQSDLYGFSEMIKTHWGIDRNKDQQMAGLIMWIPCCFIYVSASLFLVYQWLTEKEEVPDLNEEKLILKEDVL